MTQAPAEPKTDAKLWARLPEESARAHDAFMCYAKLGSGRSLEEVARRHYGPGKAPERPRKATPGGIKVWSVRFRWVERAAAWDDYQAGIRLKAMETAERERAERWVKRKDELAEQDWADAQDLRAQAKLMISLPVVTVTVAKDGKTSVIEPTSPAGVRAGAQALKDASELGWKALAAALGGDGAPGGRSDSTPAQADADALDEAGRDLDAWVAAKQREIAAIATAPPAAALNGPEVAS